jgi:hypothetical protein
MTTKREDGASPPAPGPWSVSAARDTGSLGCRAAWWPLVRGLPDRAAAETWLREHWRPDLEWANYSVHAGPETGTRETVDRWEHWVPWRLDDGEVEVRSGRDGRLL